MHTPRIFAVVGFGLITHAMLACDDDTVASPTDASSHDHDHEHDAQANAPIPERGGGGVGGTTASGGNGGKDAASIHDAGAEQDAGDADGTSAFEVRFKAVVGTRAFACGQSYSNVGTTHAQITPHDLRLYVQEVKLIAADGKSVPLTFDERDHWQAKDVALLDFEDGTGGCYGDSATNRSILGHAPSGQYNGVELVIGVPDALNHGDPATLPAPLHESGMSWNWLLGFRFLKLELGTLASDDDADAGAGDGLFHLGSVACSGNPSAGNVKCQKPNRNHVQLDGFDPTKNVIAFDLGAVFASSDLSQDTSCHSAEPACDTMFRSIGLDYASGAPANSQTAFHVE